MPLYEYECLECDLHFDRLQRFGEPQPVLCPNGHSQVHRLLLQPAIIFKGSGFSVTDNRRSSQQKPAKGGRQHDGEEPAATKSEEQAAP